jgi:hypothetical protein
VMAAPSAAAVSVLLGGVGRIACDAPPGRVSWCCGVHPELGQVNGTTDVLGRLTLGLKKKDPATCAAGFAKIAGRNAFDQKRRRTA